MAGFFIPLTVNIEFLAKDIMEPLYYDDITTLFTDLLMQAGSVDIARAEFTRLINEDDQLRAAYREWCAETGNTERNGFRDYCEEYLDGQSEKFDSLNDPYDN